MTDSERINYILTGLKTNKNRLGLSLGDKNGMRLQHVISGRNGISEDLARDINKVYPGIPYNWILNGEGDNPVIHAPIKSNAIAIPEPASDNLEVIKREDGTEFRYLGDGKHLMITPLIEQKAYGGYLSGWSDPVYIEELPKHVIVVEKLHFGIYRSFEVDGDSMNNGLLGSYPKGSIVTARLLDKSKYMRSKLHLHNYADYIIIQDDGIQIKRITNHDVENGVITCHSLNSDKHTYPDFEIHLSEVRELFNVVSQTLQTRQ